MLNSINDKELCWWKWSLRHKSEDFGEKRNGTIMQPANSDVLLQRIHPPLVLCLRDEGLQRMHHRT